MILDKIFYISAIEEIVNDYTKFSNLDIPAGKEINYIINLEKRITSDLKPLKDEEINDKAAYKNIKPVGSRPGVLYELGKVHKETKNGLPPFRPILSVIGTPTYKLAKCLLPFLTPLTQNEYTVTNSFHFAEEICKQDPNLYMAQAEKFKKYFSSKHPNIHFSLEKENDGRLSFLDSNIFHEKINLSLMFIGKRPSVVFILISTASYLKPIKPV